MIRINISKDNVRQTKSFMTIEELANFLKNKFSYYLVIDKVWLKNAKIIFNSKVADGMEISGWKFIVQSKLRSGNILMNGK